MNQDDKRQNEIEQAFLKRLTERMRKRARNATASIICLIVFIGSFFTILSQLMITNVMYMIYLLSPLNLTTDDWVTLIFGGFKLYSFGDPYISYISPLILFFGMDIAYKCLNPKEPDLIVEFVKAIKSGMNNKSPKESTK